MKQAELDKAEKYILDKLFGDISKPVISKKLQMILVAKNINFDEFINDKIQIFEEFAKDVLTDEGTLDGKKISKLLSINYPILEGIMLPDNIKPLELVTILDKLISFDKLGEWIQNF